LMTAPFMTAPLTTVPLMRGAFDDSAHASCPNAPFNALGIQSTAVAARGTQSINPSITKDSAYQTRNI
jgi:hypothetical protein